MTADTAVRDAALIREALIRDGYDNPPAVGSVFRDDVAGWLASGVASYVVVTSIGKTVNGWQCRVKRWEQFTDLSPMPTADLRSGLLYLDHLLGRQFPEIFSFTHVADGTWDAETKTWTERHG